MRLRKLATSMAVTLLLSALVLWVAGFSALRGVEKEVFEVSTPFWVPGPGYDMEIVLANSLARETGITVEVLDDAGNNLFAGDYFVEANGAKRIPLNEALPHQFQGVGSVVVTYPTEFQGRLPVQLIQSKLAKGVAMNSILFGGASGPPRDMRSPFWLPTAQSDAYCMLLNRSEEEIEVMLGIRGGRKPDQRLLLQPKQAYGFKLRKAGGLQGGSRQGALLVAHSGRHGDVIARAFVLDETRGSSYNLDFFATRPNMDFLPPSLGVLSFPALRYEARSRSQLSPVLLVSNETTQPLETRGWLQTADFSQHIELGAFHLEGHEVRLIDLTPELARLAQGDSLEASLELQYDGPEGAVTASALSVDDSFETIHQSKVKRLADLNVGYSYPFDLREDWTTKVYLTNRSDRVIEFCLFFHFEGAFYTYSGGKSLEPFEFKVIDVGAIRDDQIPDEFGRVIPHAVQEGQIKVLIHDEDGATVSAQAVLENQRSGVSVPVSCPVCPPSSEQLFFSKTATAAFGFTASYQGLVGAKERIYAIEAFDDGSIKDVSTGVSYDSSSSSVATVKKGSFRADVEFHGLGEADITGSFLGTEYVPQSSEGSCQFSIAEGSLCPCDSLPIFLMVPSLGPFGFSPAAEVLVNQIETDEIVVISWIDEGRINLPSGANGLLSTSLEDPIRCIDTVFLWANGLPALLLTDADTQYANRFLLKNSSNSNPGQFINPNSVRGGGDYRLFNRFKVRLSSFGGQVQSFIFNAASEGHVGNTPNPCSGLLPSAGPETHPANDARGITLNRTGVFQLAQGRLGSTGQAVDRTLNYPMLPPGTGTPWIWTAIKFNADGTFAPTALDHQIFPTHSVYRNGSLVRTFVQGNPETFIALTSSSQRSVNQIN